jgi:hypothetical protein
MSAKMECFYSLFWSQTFSKRKKLTDIVQTKAVV